MTYDPRYFTTYYAIDASTSQPTDMSSALDPLEAPYLPLVVQEAAGLPLDPSFADRRRSWSAATACSSAAPAAPRPGASTAC